MIQTLNKRWQKALNLLDVAFQPILNIHTGKTFAVESLLRNFKEAGFDSIHTLFNTAYKDGVLYSFDIALREKALKKFTKIPEYKNIKLFYNLDNRLFKMPDFSSGNTKAILKKLNIKEENIYFEISQRDELDSSSNLQAVLEHYQHENFCIAIDGFGVGCSSYKLLYDATPDVIKIDRFFLQNIQKDMKKQLMLRSITNLAILMGIQVIAEYVETEAELLICKDIGCHLVQGYLVQKPTLHASEIQKEYQNIVDILLRSKRNKNRAAKIDPHLQKIEPIHKKDDMNRVISYFRENKGIEVVPVLNSKNEPIGILYERDIKEYVYSPYGLSILLNKTTENSKLKNFIIKAPVIDINSDINRIIELYTNNPQSAGIIVTSDSLYLGFLSARAILNIVNEENLIAARDQNPLTKLPGNRIIENYITTISINGGAYMLCYFDLDNFKAYNDVYGFRNGDRVIQLFADILKTQLPAHFFKAHIGGDDFFIAKEIESEYSLCLSYIEEVINNFCVNASKFYSIEDQQRGYILAKDRDSQLKKFPMLSVSASVLLTKEDKLYSTNTINEVLSLQKKVAKNEPSHIAVCSLT